MATDEKATKGKRAAVKRKTRNAKLVQYGKPMKRKGIDMLALCGKLTITVDPLEYQRESRGDD